MNRKTSNIALIGMPGAGKSTIGVLLAKIKAMGFVDTDLLIQSQYGNRLQSIVDQEGYLALRELEERVICSMNHTEHVIATGGSAVYSEKSMSHLRTNSIIIFLDVTFDEIKRRVTDFDSRGIAMRSGQTFSDLYDERVPLYRKSADLTINCNGKNQDQITREIHRKTTEPLRLKC